jgi:ribosomal protein S18 acetylase RimI-like enzyme
MKRNEQQPRGCAVDAETASIRPLRAADLDEVAAIHCRAFPGYPNVLLGRRYVRSMLRWFAGEEQGIAIGAFGTAERPLGYVIGAPVDLVKKLGRALLPAALVGFVTHPWLVLHPRIRVTVTSRLRDRFGERPAYEMPTIPTPCMGLFSIAVSTEAHGRGVGKRLMTAFEDDSRRLAMRSMYLSVFPENAAARKMYAATGWQALDVPPKPGDAMHYVKLLDPQ